MPFDSQLEFHLQSFALKVRVLALNQRASAQRIVGWCSRQPWRCVVLEVRRALAARLRTHEDAANIAGRSRKGGDSFVDVLLAQHGPRSLHFR